MVQLSLLETGAAIILAGLVLMDLGRRTFLVTRKVFDKEGVNLQPQGQGGITERIFAFSVEETSELDVRLSNIMGWCSFAVAQIPAPAGRFSSLEEHTEWIFPKILEADTRNQSASRTKLHKGVYGLRISNQQVAMANMTLMLSLTEHKTRFPRFYAIGTQILVVGIPLLIASFFS